MSDPHLTSESVRDDEHCSHVVAVHQLSGRRSIGHHSLLRIGVDGRDQVEVAGIDERRDERPALRRAIAVVDGEPDVADVEIQRVTVEQQHEQGHEQQRHQRPRIACDLAELLACDGGDLPHVSRPLPPRRGTRPRATAAPARSTRPAHRRVPTVPSRRPRRAHHVSAPRARRCRTHSSFRHPARAR